MRVPAIQLTAFQRLSRVGCANTARHAQTTGDGAVLVARRAAANQVTEIRKMLDPTTEREG